MPHPNPRHRSVVPRTVTHVAASVYPGQKQHGQPSKHGSSDPETRGLSPSLLQIRVSRITDVISSHTVRTSNKLLRIKLTPTDVLIDMRQVSNRSIRPGVTTPRP